MPIFIISHSHMVRDILKSNCKLRDFDVADAYPNSSALTTMENGAVVVLHTGRNLEDVEKQLTHLYSLCHDIRIMLITPESAIDDIRKKFSSQVHAILAEDNPTETLIGALAVISSGYYVAVDPPPDFTDNGKQRKSAKRQVRNGTKTQIPLNSMKIEILHTALSPREKEVLAKLREGGSNKDIAKALGICEATVKVYLRTCFQKIGVKNRTQAAIWASKHR